MTTKNNLRGKSLNVLVDKPPREIKTKSGAIMNELEVFDENSHSYKILVTDLDLDRICGIVSKGLRFSFDDTEPWANVAEVEKNGKVSSDK